MAVLGALNLDPRVLAERNAERQGHGADEVVGVQESLAGPSGDEETPKQHEPAVHPAEQEHLVAPNARHKVRQLSVVVRLRNDAVDLGDEDVRHHRREGDENVPDLDRHGEHSHDRRTREGSEQHIRDALVDELAQLVDEDPRRERRDGTEERRIEPPEAEAHPEPEVGEPHVERQQDNRDGELCETDANGAEALAEQDEGDPGSRERREHLPGLLVPELLVGDDVRIEDGGEERQGNVARHDGHELSGKSHLVGREAPREKGTDVYGEHETQRQHDGADHRVQHQVHTVQDTYVPLVAPRPFLGVETDVRLRETEREESEREDERVRGLIDAVVRLPHKG